MSVDLIAEARKVIGPGPDVQRTVMSTPRAVPGDVKTVALGLVGLGLAALAYGLLGGDVETKHRTLGALLVCIVYFAGVSMGGVMFPVAQTITLGRWGRPFKRIAESFAAFQLVIWPLWWIFLLAGGTEIYEWTHEPMHGHKAIYLSYGFFVGRQIVGTGILFLLSFWFVSNSLRPDLGVAAEMLGSKAPAWWSNWTRGWKGRDAEVEQTYQKNIRLAPVIVVAYALLFTMFAVDAVMSLAPHWYANMFPGWIFVSSFWLTLNWICIISVFSKKWLGIDHLLTGKNYHDLGKLMFALCVFWAYTLFAQILPIWYGNMPEETGYLLLRMYADPWSALSKVVFLMCFLIPFTILLSRGIKKMPESLVGVAMVIAVGVYLERFLLVMPQVWKQDSLPLGPIEILIFLGFVGGFVSVVTRVLSQVPAVPITDPFMNENPADVHVHPYGEHGHGHAHGH